MASTRYSDKDLKYFRTLIEEKIESPKRSCFNKKRLYE
jgi:hypothetical protein